MSIGQLEDLLPLECVMGILALRLIGRGYPLGATVIPAKLVLRESGGAGIQSVSGKKLGFVSASDLRRAGGRHLHFGRDFAASEASSQPSSAQKEKASFKTILFLPNPKMIFVENKEHRWIYRQNKPKTVRLCKSKISNDFFPDLMAGFARKTKQHLEPLRFHEDSSENGCSAVSDSQSRRTKRLNMRCFRSLSRKMSALRARIQFDNEPNRISGFISLRYSEKPHFFHVGFAK